MAPLVIVVAMGLNPQRGVDSWTRETGAKISELQFATSVPVHRRKEHRARSGLPVDTFDLSDFRSACDTEVIHTDEIGSNKGKP